jgi:hypothetical protein
VYAHDARSSRPYRKRSRTGVFFEVSSTDSLLAKYQKSAVFTKPAKNGRKEETNILKNKRPPFFFKNH